MVFTVALILHQWRHQVLTFLANTMSLNASDHILVTFTGSDSFSFHFLAVSFMCTSGAFHVIHFVQNLLHYPRVALDYEKSGCCLNTVFCK